MGGAIAHGNLLCGLDLCIDLMLWEVLAQGSGGSLGTIVASGSFLAGTQPVVFSV